MAVFSLRGAGFLMDADDLGRARRIDGANLLGGLEALAADDEAVFAAEVRGHLVERRAHGARILRIVEVGEGLIGKHALRRARLDRGRNTSDSHNEFSLRSKCRRSGNRDQEAESGDG